MDLTTHYRSCDFTHFTHAPTEPRFFTETSNFLHAKCQKIHNFFPQQFTSLGTNHILLRVNKWFVLQRMNFETIPLYNKIIHNIIYTKRSSEGAEQTRVAETEKCAGKIRSGANKKYTVRDRIKRGC